MTTALSLSNISKRFGTVRALHGASIAVRPGTVHALLGENGAGKTTLMHIAYGMHRPDHGHITVNGQPVMLTSPAHAIQYGIGMVHQHFTLVPAMSVAENVALGLHGLYDARRASERVRLLGEATGLVLDPDARVADLSVGGQQRLEILKAMSRNAHLLILDEPTAVLAPSESDDLMRWVRRFCSDGHAVVLITHKLREAIRVSDDVTVLRHGVTVAAGAVAQFDEAALVRAMLGDDAPLPPAGGRVSIVGEVVLALHHVSVERGQSVDALYDVSLEVRQGEIVGIAAVEGSGQHTLLRLLSGRLKSFSGTIVRPNETAFIPEDRHRDALVLSMSLVENMALRGLGPRTGRMPWNALRSETMQTLRAFDVRATDGESVARSLSGGNQQKFVIGRELATQTAAVVIENPTRGLDVRAAVAVHEQLRIARAAGSAVVFFSSDIDEVLALADRILVMRAGQIRAIEGSRDSIGRAMLGAS